MKKIIAIIFLVIYGLSFVGSTIHIHYCMNRLLSASLIYQKKDKCSRCGMKTGRTNGCCKDIHIPIKTDKEHQQAHSCKLPVNYPVATAIICTNIYSSFIYKITPAIDKPIRIIDPFHDISIPIYKTKCTYRV